MRTLLVPIIALSLLIAAQPAQGTTLVADKNHPFSVRQMTRLQGCVDQSKSPTIPGRIVLSADVTEVIAGGLAGNHYIALADTSCFSLLHELAHESQMFIGPGSKIWAGQNYGAGAVGWSDWKIYALSALLGVKAGSNRMAELSADASAVCGLYGLKWRQWWGHYKRRSKQVSVWVATPTPYGFQAGPKRYQMICGALATLS